MEIMQLMIPTFKYGKEIQENLESIANLYRSFFEFIEFFKKVKEIDEIMRDEVFYNVSIVYFFQKSVCI